MMVWTGAPSELFRRFAAPEPPVGLRRTEHRSLALKVKDRIAVIEAPEANPRKKVTRFSIIGYSLGGLLSRYAVGILYSTGFFDDGKVKPVNFATIATPNIGLLRYNTLLSTVTNTFGPTFLSRTGKHFYAKDADEWGAGEGKPLLEVMSEKGAASRDSYCQRKIDPAGGGQAVSFTTL